MEPSSRDVSSNIGVVDETLLFLQSLGMGPTHETNGGKECKESGSGDVQLSVIPSVQVLEPTAENGAKEEAKPALQDGSSEYPAENTVLSSQNVAEPMDIVDESKEAAGLAQPTLVPNQKTKEDLELERNRTWEALLAENQLLSNYPFKLSLPLVKTKTLLDSDGQPKILSFLHLLMHNHSDAREKLIDSGEENPVNSADMLFCLLMVSDPFLRQELYSKMATLQYAVPFLLQPTWKTPSPLLMSWSLQAVVKRWRVKDGFAEDDMNCAKFPYFSFIRFGECEISKSEVLNQLVGRGSVSFLTEKYDGAPRRISNGNIEMTWLLDRSDPAAILNLRGNAAMYSETAQFLASRSATLFVFVGSDLDSLEGFLREVTRRVDVVLLIPKNSKRLDKEKLLAITSFVRREDVICDIVAKLKGEIDARLTNRAKDCGKVSLAAWEQEAENYCIQSESMANRKLQVAKELAEKTVLQKIPLEFQGNVWSEWCKLNKEQARMKNINSGVSVEAYTRDVKDKKEALRKQQAQIRVCDEVLHLLSQLCGKEKDKRYLLYWLQYLLDRQSKDKNVRNPIGLEHLLREVAQLYEASQYGSLLPRTLAKTLRNNSARAEMLVNPIIDSLVGGQPVELLDGDAQGIPELWMKALFGKLASRIRKDAKLGVVSVLGVQSSGKSTLLNIMFGCKFAVSTGRCTRGVNMQLLKVDKNFRAAVGNDYILILDSEGLKAPENEKASGENEHDSELCTLVIGLSDVVIINVASESMDALKDIIQITIHAFIRMESGNKQKTKCVFVHQNTGDPSAYEKLRSDRIYFERKLQESTDAAVAAEYKDDRKMKFTDILDYSSDGSHFYFPGLYTGTPPMAPINTGYAEAALSVKKVVLESLVYGKKLTCAGFFTRLNDIWYSVLKENFLFSHKNTLIALKKMELDVFVSTIEHEFRMASKQLIDEVEVEIRNTEDRPDVGTLDRRIKKFVEIRLQSMTEQLGQYLEKDELSYKHFKEEAELSISTFVMREEERLTNSVRIVVKKLEGDKKVDELQSSLENMIRSRITEIVADVKANNVRFTDEEAINYFDGLWQKEIGGLGDKYKLMHIRKMDIAVEVESEYRGWIPYAQRKHLKSILERGLTAITDEAIDLDRKNFSFLGMVNQAYLTPAQLKKANTDVKNLIAITDRSIKESLLNTRKEVCIFELVDSLCSNAKSYLNKLLYLKVWKIQEESQYLILGHVCSRLIQPLKNFYMKYLEEHEPALKLCREKKRYQELFTTLYKGQGLANSAAKTFLRECLVPGIRSTLEIKLDGALVDILKRKSKDFATKKSCEAAFLRDLKKKSDFSLYLEAVHQYEHCMKVWLGERLKAFYFELCPCELCLPNKRTRLSHELLERAESISEKVKESLQNVLEVPKGSDDVMLTDVLEYLSTEMRSVAVLKLDALAPFAQSVAGPDFAQQAVHMMDDLGDIIGLYAEEIFNSVKEPAKDFLFNTVIGCGSSCPFCGAPCSHNSSQHPVHSADIHRPQAVFGYSFEGTDFAMIDVCNQYVAGTKTFKNQETNWDFVKYANYKSIYNDWDIAPDTECRSGLFWKWVISNRASEFISYYGFEKSSIPNAWESITWDQVERQLQQLSQVQATPAPPSVESEADTQEEDGTDYDEAPDDCSNVEDDS